ncbi:MAG: DUF2764 family protein [Candidatus Omnitrophica bacterium]|nr:DUF2764 family protein [Candidatus Omnitrophota bacterium]
MESFYVYLISSLPSLVMRVKPPFSFDSFLRRCSNFISAEDLAAVESVRHPERIARDSCNETLRKWRAFDTMIRNELVKIRSLRRKSDPAKYLRPDGSPESAYYAHAAINAYRKPSPVESEMALDTDRWRYLDELSMGHYFDLDFLITYACKLLILEKWDAAGAADARKTLEEVLSR